MTLTEERVRAMPAWLEELAVESEAGLASQDYYVGGLIGAPDPADVRELAQLATEWLALRAQNAEFREMLEKWVAYAEWATGEFLPPDPKVFRGKMPDEVEADLRARLTELGPP